ncbi:MULTISPECIES: hypothetical protein [Haloarcula]|uniref:hypothetical protein n=1 Tax=Haloarcula TaxID=2237 RepID=UPI0023E7B527|nr:hypothetical protein [Halomicroarcula sp. SHR3]
MARLGRVLPNSGEYIFDREWDGLIVLDACRVDALEEVADEYEFIPTDISSIVSRASMSETWLRQNFTADFLDEIEGTAYVSANGHTNGFETGEFGVSADDFETLETVSEYAFDEELGTIPPQAVTNVGIDYLRNADPDRFILHYMQPHTPYRGLDLEGARGDGSLFRENVWDLMHVGELSRDEVWEHYLDTLRWVLDEVEIVLENVDAESVVITADHGECFGERWMYGHPRHGRVDALREVPWIETQATDERTYTAESVDKSAETASLEEQLEALGYR